MRDIAFSILMGCSAYLQVNNYPISAVIFFLVGLAMWLDHIANAKNRGSNEPDPNR